jgi:glucose-1-phosphatase
MLNQDSFSRVGISAAQISGIKNIIFDLGGVIIDIHYNKTIEQFKNVGFDDFENIYSLMKQSDLFTLLETGKIPAQAFRDELRKFQRHLTDEQIDNAWNTMIGNMPVEHLHLLQSLQKGYRTFLLSNTNEIHMGYFTQYLVDKFGHNPLLDMFERVYFSHEIGKRKPDANAYEAVLKDAGLAAHETLFIDDLEANIEGARKVGILAYQLKNESITTLFLP